MVQPAKMASGLGGSGDHSERGGFGGGSCYNTEGCFCGSQNGLQSGLLSKSLTGKIRCHVATASRALRNNGGVFIHVAHGRRNRAKC